MEIEKLVSLKEYSWWKIGGLADYFCLPNSIEQVREALQWARTNHQPVTVLGGGTNVLISDRGVPGLVICLRRLTGVEANEGDGRVHISALAGTPKSELVKIFLKRKLAPALFLCGLPGDVGGGVAMNAGVAEAIVPREFVEIVDWIEVVDIDTLSLKRFTRDQLRWTYRHSEGWQPGVVVRAGLSWDLAVDPDISRKVKDATKMRLQKQPLELPSCGSTFKNPPGAKAGALIDQAGLKGYRVGGAEVSAKHANFIVNTGGASAQDVWNIIRHVRAQVAERFGVQLETEVKLLGRWD